MPTDKKIFDPLHDYDLPGFKPLTAKHLHNCAFCGHRDVDHGFQTDAQAECFEFGCFCPRFEKLECLADSPWISNE